MHCFEPPFWESSASASSKTGVFNPHLFSGEGRTASAAVQKYTAKRKWEAALEGLSVLISSPHSAAPCLCNREELLHVRRNITVVKDNWGIIM